MNPPQQADRSVGQVPLAGTRPREAQSVVPYSHTPVQGGGSQTALHWPRFVNSPFMSWTQAPASVQVKRLGAGGAGGVGLGVGWRVHWASLVHSGPMLGSVVWTHSKPWQRLYRVGVTQPTPPEGQVLPAEQAMTS